MKIHRFYTPDLELSNELWLSAPELLHQWTKVLRFREGQKVVLFDGVERERLYAITEISGKEAYLELVTDYQRQVPKKDIYVFWSLLKKDKNDWVLQKCTELGASHFIPLIADRSEKTGFNAERAKRIVIEAAEQCGRSDIPAIRDAMHVKKALEQYSGKLDLYVCEQNSEGNHKINKKAGVLIGPEGGWSDEEKELFEKLSIKHLNLHDFMLRAETAAIVAAKDLIG